MQLGQYEATLLEVIKQLIAMENSNKLQTNTEGFFNEYPADEIDRDDRYSEESEEYSSVETDDRGIYDEFVFGRTM